MRYSQLTEELDKRRLSQKGTHEEMVSRLCRSDMQLAEQAALATQEKDKKLQGGVPDTPVEAQDLPSSSSAAAAAPMAPPPIEVPHLKVGTLGRLDHLFQNQHTSFFRAVDQNPDLTLAEYLHSRPPYEKRYPNSRVVFTRDDRIPDRREHDIPADYTGPLRTRSLEGFNAREYIPSVPPSGNVSVVDPEDLPRPSSSRPTSFHPNLRPDTIQIPVVEPKARVKEPPPNVIRNAWTPESGVPGTRGETWWRMW